MSAKKDKPATLSSLGPQEQKRARGEIVVSRRIAPEFLTAAKTLRISELRGEAGQLSDSFQLAMPQNWKDPKAPRLNWSQVNLERFVVNLPSGRQESVAEGAQQGRTTLAYAPQEVGTMTYLLCVNTWGRLADSPDQESLYCVKQIRSENERSLGAERGASSHSRSRASTSRFGEPVELRPLVPPEKAILGADVPIMAYVGADRARESTLFVIAPDGSRREIVTGNAGKADLRIDQQGDWRVFLVGELEGKTAVAELSFSNAEAK